jgi:hypothetical protein
MRAQLHAVLIADIVNSSARANLRSLLSAKLAEASRSHLRRKLIKLPYSVTAGDEFQAVAAGLEPISSLILDLRIRLRPLALRIGIGIGCIDGPLRPPVNQLSGPAFQSARLAIEHLKSKDLFRYDALTAFQTPDARFNSIVNLLYGLNDTLLTKIKTKQWQAITAYREHHTLARTARKLRLDISTVSRNLKRGYYWQLMDTTKASESLIKDAFL